MNLQCVCFSPVHPEEPVCFFSWPAAVSAPPAAHPVSAVHCFAVPAAAAPPALPALVSENTFCKQ